MTIMRNFSPSRLLALGILFTLAACDSAPGLEYEVANPQFGLELIGSDPLPITVSQAQAWSTVDPGAEVTCTDRDNPNLGVIRRSDNSPGTSPGEYTVTYTFENATPVTRKVIVSPDNPTCGGAISINSSVNDLTAMLDIQQTGFDEVSADFGNGWVTVTGNTISNDYDSYGNKVIQVRARRANCPDVIRTLNVTLTDPGDGGGTGDNEAPILNSGEVSVEVGSSTTLDLLSILSAIDPDGDDIDVLRIEQPPAGSFSSLNQEAGTVVYNAPSSPRSRFTVQVTATDGEVDGFEDGGRILSVGDLQVADLDDGVGNDGVTHRR